MKLLLTIVLLIVGFLPCYTQTFNKTLYFEGESEYGNIIHFTDDDNIIWIGAGDSENSDTKALYLFKTDLLGYIIDSTLYRNDLVDIDFTNVRGFISRYYQNIIIPMVYLENNLDAVLIAVDQSLNINFELVSMSDSLDVFINSMSIGDKLYITGSTSYTGNGSADYWLQKYNDTLGLLYDFNIGGTEFEEMGNSYINNNQQIVFSGRTNTYTNQHPYFIGSATNGHLLCVDTNFNLVWETVLWSDGFDKLPVIKEHGFFATGYEIPMPMTQTPFHYTVGQIDDNTGIILWEDTVEIEEEIMALRFLESVDDTSFIVYYSVEEDGYSFGLSKIIKYNNQGEILWERTYYEGNISGARLLNSAIKDGYLYFVGTVGDNDHNSQDMWILKLDENGCLDGDSCDLGTTTVDLTLGKDTFGIAIFPNPAKDKATIIIENTALYKGEYVDMSIYDSQGKQVHLERFFINGALPQMEVDVSTYASGIYNVQVCVDGKECGIAQLVVE